MNGLRVLVVGSGGREHALAWRLARDPECAEVVVAPGNDGMARAHRCLPVSEQDAAGLVDACRAESVDLVVVGPEAPLAAGVADALRAAGVVVFGPSAAAARLEGSKWFAKELMREARVLTARAERGTTLAEVRAALDRLGPPHVVKADGLAAGKGVCVTGDRAQAEAFARAALEDGRFGAAGSAVVVEEHLSGEEISVMAVCDGSRAALLPSARDHKRAFEADAGANTGGMGAYAPADVDAATLERVSRTVVSPTLAALAAHGWPFVGLLYAGLMMTPSGPRVLEFNVRFGDPETQVVLPLLGGSLTRLLQDAARGTLDPAALAAERGAAVTVAIVDAGYPERPQGGGTIEGLERLMADPELLVFHAGTRLEDGAWRVRGGRAVYVTARAESRAAARDRVYAAIDTLRGGGWRVRRDIAAGSWLTTAETGTRRERT